MGPTTENCVFSYSIKLNKLKVDVVAPALGAKRRAPSDGAWRLLQVLPLALAQAPGTERRRWRQTHPKPFKKTIRNHNTSKNHTNHLNHPGEAA